MAKATLWHNPRCSKSRQGMALLQDHGIDVDIVKYLDTPPSKEEITTLLDKLGIEPRALMRTKEKIYKTLNLAAVEDPERLIEAMTKHPSLIERPVAIVGDKAVLGRPPELILDIL